MVKIVMVCILLSGCSKPIEQNDLPSYSDMSAAEDLQEALTKP
jgi:hypothetical protein